MDVKKQPHSLLTLVTIIFSSCFGLDGNDVLYIIPSLSSPCPVKSCLTLSQFAANMNWIKSETTLVFLPGNHTLHSDVLVSNISIFSMVSNPGFLERSLIIVCEQNASFKFDGISDKVWIRGLNFVGCGNNRAVSVKHFTIENSTFQGQNASGSALEVNGTSIEIDNSSFISNTVGSCLNISDDISYKPVRVGGAIFATQSNVTITKSKFVGNSAEMGGAISSCRHSNITIINSTFVENWAAPAKLKCSNSVFVDRRFCIGGAIFATDQSTKLIINGSTFSNNIGDSGGAGALSIQESSSTEIYNSTFWNNTAKDNGFGGALIVAKAQPRVTIDKCVFYNNSAYHGGALGVLLSSVIISDSTFSNSSAVKSGGVITIDQTSYLDVSGSQFTNNMVTDGHGGVLSAVRATITLKDSYLCNNQATDSTSGGAIYLSQSEITFNGHCSLTGNFASTNGGAIYASESRLRTTGKTVIVSNVANDSGGGLYLYHSNLKCQNYSTLTIMSNRAMNSGGGIHAINSLITVFRDRSKCSGNSLSFTDNSAMKGGGICLESASQLRVQKTDDEYAKNCTARISLYFTSNLANFGEAIYVVDETYFEVCARGSKTIDSTTTTTVCFIQVLAERATLSELDKHNLVSVEFTPSNSTIVGGLLDRCTLDSIAEAHYFNGSIPDEVDGMTYLKFISNINDTNGISSSPVRLCFCTHDQPDCSSEAPSFQVKKGESFNVSLVAVDQVNHTVLNVMIHSSLRYAESGLSEGQLTQITKNACTNLTFNVYSLHSSEQLILYAEGPCRNVSRSQRRVNVTLLNCTCPPGFQPKHVEISCECVCDSRLSPYITDNDCNYPTESLTRKGNYWITCISFINDSCNSTSGFLIYSHCPLDYCLPSHSNVQINLNMVNSSDAQCANNRSGMLCGACQPGLSLSLGNSRCINCSETWYKQFVAIVIVCLLAGIVLITLLMIFNLTVAVGSLNGLIFYANIIGANSSTFFQPPSAKFLSIFISWLNLEVGFDTCFFEGMDTYWRTWLQLAFPTYIIFLVVMVIIVSEHSMRVSHLIAKKNPVATLATVILFSYTMFLHTIIAVLSFATLMVLIRGYGFLMLLLNI